MLLEMEIKSYPTDQPAEEYLTWTILVLNFTPDNKKGHHFKTLHHANILLLNWIYESKDIESWSFLMDEQIFILAQKGFLTNWLFKWFKANTLLITYS